MQKVRVIEVEGELAIEFPMELLAKLNWKLGDELLMSEKSNGFSLIKTIAEGPNATE